MLCQELPHSICQPLEATWHNPVIFFIPVLTQISHEVQGTTQSRAFISKLTPSVLVPGCTSHLFPTSKPFHHALWPPCQPLYCFNVFPQLHLISLSDLIISCYAESLFFMSILLFLSSCISGYEDGGSLSAPDFIRVQDIPVASS